MALQYKIEMIQPENEEADDSAFIHLKTDVPTFQNRIGKEAYSRLDSEDKHDFIDGLFALSGVTEVSATAFRVWVMKSPSFTWEEVLSPVLFYIRDELEETDVESLPGSAKLDGSGIRLSSLENRRRL